MPELPEVETVRRGLLPLVEGQRIARAVQNRPDLRWPLPEKFADRLTGRKVEAIRRRAKYLLLDLDGRAGETLLIHLGMSGRLLLKSADAAPVATAAFLHKAVAGKDGGKHDHVVLHFENGVTAIFNDARRFGAMDLHPSEMLDAHPWLARLGPEPLSNDFNAAYLREAFGKSRTSLKAALLDQRRISGLGNIYVCEALYRARLSPLREAGSLGAEEAEVLTSAIRSTLSDAIEAGGSSLRDFHGASGELGYFQHSFAVYGRTDALCNICATPIRRIQQAGRSTFYCATCQS